MKRLLMHRLSIDPSSRAAVDCHGSPFCCRNARVSVAFTNAVNKILDACLNLSKLTIDLSPRLLRCHAVQRPSYHHDDKIINLLLLPPCTAGQFSLKEVNVSGLLTDVLSPITRHKRAQRDILAPCNYIEKLVLTSIEGIGPQNFGKIPQLLEHFIKLQEA
jgi:hypothetical protein